MQNSRVPNKPIFFVAILFVSFPSIHGPIVWYENSRAMGPTIISFLHFSINTLADHLHTPLCKEKYLYLNSWTIDPFHSSVLGLTVPLQNFFTIKSLFAPRLPDPSLHFTKTNENIYSTFFEEPGLFSINWPFYAHNWKRFSSHH